MSFPKNDLSLQSRRLFFVRLDIENHFYILAGDHIVLHLLSAPAVIGIKYPFLREHLRVFRVQLIYLRQLFYAQIIKGRLGRLVQCDLLPVCLRE